MRLPIIMLSGPAGSGKDTVADFLVKNHGAVKIAQADPMKRLAARLFGFSEETLWGPSGRRNDCMSPQVTKYEELQKIMLPWVDEVLPWLNSEDQESAVQKLHYWYEHFFNGDPTTARRVLQTLGTEWGRAFSKNMWIDLALRNARALLEGGCAHSRTEGVVDSVYPAPAYRLAVITDGRFRNEILAVRAAGGATVKIVSPGPRLSGTAGAHVSETEQDSMPHNWFDVVLTNYKAAGLGTLQDNVAELLHEIGSNPREVPRRGRTSP